MKLYRTDAMNLNGALSQRELKVKHVSGPNYMTVLRVKKNLARALNDLFESEQALIKDLDLEGIPDDKLTIEQIKDRNSKLIPLQKDFSVEIETGFLPEQEFKEYTKEQDTNVTSVLAEFLLKDF